MRSGRSSVLVCVECIAILCVFALLCTSCLHQAQDVTAQSDRGSFLGLGRPVVSPDGRAVFYVRRATGSGATSSTVVLLYDHAGGCREMYATRDRVTSYALGRDVDVVFAMVERRRTSEVAVLREDAEPEFLPVGPELHGLGHGVAPPGALAGRDSDRVHLCQRTAGDTWRWVPTASIKARFIVWTGSGGLYACRIRRERMTTQVLELHQASRAFRLVADVPGFVWAAEPLGGAESDEILVGRSWDGQGGVWEALSVFDAGTGAVRDVVTVPPGLPKLRSFASSADGREVVYIRNLGEPSCETVIVSLETGSCRTVYRGNDMSGPFFLSEGRVGFFEETASVATLWSIGADGTDRRMEWTSSSMPPTTTPPGG